jgi:DNA-binding winged helix-turn-helix (wHTH) protein
VSKAAIFGFGSFELDPETRRLARAGEAITLGDRHLSVLLHLVTNAGHVISKDDLIAAGWGDVAVTDNSLEQVISSLRRVLGDRIDDQPLVETVPRRGYRFAARVTRMVRRETDEALDDLLSPYRAWIEGRAALETFERDQIVRAREAFQSALARASDQAPPHVGLANACVMQFEATRADATPDVAALTMAADHAREACRLDPNSGEAWATLGFVLDRVGRRVDALAASRRAVVLEPDNWRHHFRLASVGWGEERLRAALRVLTLLPGFPLAHWLAATVYVARQALGEAERELVAGLTAQGAGSEYHRFGSVALHWLRGLIALARADTALAIEEFQRELSSESEGHLYARECAANTWYAIGALRLRQRDIEGARAAFSESMARVAAHPIAAVALSAIDPQRSDARPVDAGTSRATDTDRAMLGAIRLTLQGSPDAAAGLVDQALVAAPPGNAAWVLPVEPLLNVAAQPQLWAGALSRLRARAA